MITVRDMFLSDAGDGKQLHMSVTPVIKKRYVGKISIFIQHSTQMLR